MKIIVRLEYENNYFCWLLFMTNIYKICYLIKWFYFNFGRIPESPRWLLNHRKVEEAYKVLIRGAKMNGVKLSIEDKEALKETITNIEVLYFNDDTPGNSKYRFWWLYRSLWLITRYTIHIAYKNFERLKPSLKFRFR